MARGLFAQQNTEKTANMNSRINFYFVTSFYRLDNICIVGRKTCFLSKKTLSHLFCSLSFPSAIEISQNACRDYYVNGRNPK